MSKELEALRRLRDGYENKYYKQFTSSREKQEEDYNLVEKALKRNERMKKYEYIIRVNGEDEILRTESPLTFDMKNNSITYDEQTKENVTSVEYIGMVGV